MTLREVTSFFETYRDAFNRLDGDAVADLWHGASGITDTRDGVAVQKETAVKITALEDTELVLVDAA